MKITLAQCGTNLTVTLSEHECDTCGGTGRVSFRHRNGGGGLDSDSYRCECDKGFNKGFRWSASIFADDECDELIDSISTNTTKRDAMSDIYAYAKHQGAERITIRTWRYGEKECATHAVRPRYKQ